MRNLVLNKFSLSLILWILSFSPLQAEGVHPRLSFNSAIDLPVIAATGIAVGAFTLFEENLSPSQCRWCQPNGFDSSARNQLRWSNHNLANNLSHITGFVLTPAWALGTHAWLDWKHNDSKSFYEDALVISETTLIAGLVGQAIQFSVGRERPDTHYLGAHANQNARNTSFYSGHSTIAFALATSSGTVASLRGREEAPLIWAGGLVFAGFTSYLRVAADRHYLTDVLVGAAAGSAIGFAVPYFFHAPEKNEQASQNYFQWMILPSPNGVLASLDYKW
jgi:membrane-associated phospholipid phosphatase